MTGKYTITLPVADQMYYRYVEQSYAWFYRTALRVRFDFHARAAKWSVTAARDSADERRKTIS